MRSTSFIHNYLSIPKGNDKSELVNKRNWLS